MWGPAVRTAGDEGHDFDVLSLPIEEFSDSFEGKGRDRGKSEQAEIWLCWQAARASGVTGLLEISRYEILPVQNIGA